MISTMGLAIYFWVIPETQEEFVQFFWKDEATKAFETIHRNNLVLALN